MTTQPDDATPSADAGKPHQITRHGYDVLLVMQLAPLDWWSGPEIRRRMQGRARTFRFYTGLNELKSNGLITRRWEPLPGEMEEEAQLAVHAEQQARDAWEKAARQRSWRHEPPPKPEMSQPLRRTQYRLTDAGRTRSIPPAAPREWRQRIQRFLTRIWRDADL